MTAGETSATAAETGLAQTHPQTGARKAVAKAMVAAAGVDVPVGEVLRRGERPTITPPAVVKPEDADEPVDIDNPPPFGSVPVEPNSR